MDISKETIIKFKRNKTTYVAYVDLHLKSQQTVDNLKAHLIDLLNASGGLDLNEPEDDEMDADDIPIPKSEFIDEVEIKTEPSVDATVPLSKVENVTVSDIRIAIAKDKTAPYANEWIELVDDNTVASIELKDYVIIAFGYGNEDFFITEAVYDE